MTASGNPVPSDPVSRLYTEHERWLCGWLRSKLGDAADVPDLAHDTFVRILVSARQSAGLPARLWREPRAYLALVANGLVIDLWRRRAIERAYLDALAQLPEPLAPSPETRALLLEALYQVDAMLAQLPGKVRQAFLYAQLDGMTYGDIAVRLQVSERMVRKYMARAMLHCALAEAVADTGQQAA